VGLKRWSGDLRDLDCNECEDADEVAGGDADGDTDGADDIFK
jgi:hypothetical protein